MTVSFKTQTVTVVRAPLVTDRYNAQVRDWANATSTPLTDCRVQPLAASGGLIIEPGRDAVVTRWKLLAPDGADVLASDRIVWQGKTYEVDGDVELWSSPTGSLAHVEGLLKRVEG